MVRNEGGSGRYEPPHHAHPGAGAMVSARCDECGLSAVGRHLRKVSKGPLRGMIGRICGRCLAMRDPQPQESDSEGGDQDIAKEAAA